VQPSLGQEQVARSHRGCFVVTAQSAGHYGAEAEFHTAEADPAHSAAQADGILYGRLAACTLPGYQVALEEEGLGGQLFSDSGRKSPF